MQSKCNMGHGAGIAMQSNSYFVKQQQQQLQQKWQPGIATSTTAATAMYITIGRFDSSQPEPASITIIPTHSPLTTFPRQISDLCGLIN